MNITNHNIRHKALSKTFRLWLLLAIGLNACAADKNGNLTTPTFIPTGQLQNSSSSNEPTTQVIAETSPAYIVTAPTSSSQAVAPIIESASNDCLVQNTYMWQVSPDGQWIARSAGDLGYLAIMSCNDNRKLQLSFQEITGIAPCLGYINEFGETSCFYGILHIHHWDRDSRYLFVNVDYLIDRAYEFSFGLYRLDVKTHQISPWLRTSLDYTYRYAFSPDDGKLAYISSADVYTIYVNSIETGQVSNYKIPGEASDVAYLVWSPDNQKVAFSILHEGWFDDKGGFSLALLDIIDGKITVLISNNKRLFYPTGWSSTTKINLSNRTSLSEYQYDLQTDELEEVP